MLDGPELFRSPNRASAGSSRAAGPPSRAASRQSVAPQRRPVVRVHKVAAIEAPAPPEPWPTLKETTCPASPDPCLFDTPSLPP